MDKPACRLTEALLKEGVIEVKDARTIDYAIIVLKSEFTKTLLLLFLFGALGKLIPFLFLMALSIPLRIFLGGVHLSGSVSCFLMSLAVYGLELLLLPQWRLSPSVYYCLLAAGASFVCIAPLAPSEKRPIYSKEKYRRNKRLGIAYCIAVSCLLPFGMDFGYLTRCGIWAMCIQAVQLFTVQVLQISKRRNQNV